MKDQMLKDHSQLQQQPQYDNAEYETYLFCLKRHVKGANLVKERTIITSFPDANLVSNKVSTSKYTLLTFLPKMLIYQFSKLANVYFLIIGVMQCMPSITISQGKPVMYLPFSVILCISALKEIFEDKKRKDQDNLENNHLVIQKEDQTEKQTCSQFLHPGHIIKICKNEQIPADVLLLQSSEENGVCYAETMNLDGETNLKLRLVPTEIQNLSWEEINQIEVIYEAPNKYLYQFNGKIAFENKFNVGVSGTNILLRGCQLKNTEFIYGMVLYSGHETKVMMNSIQPSPKLSSLERQMNKMIVMLFSLQIILCVATACAHCYWTYKEEDFLQYIQKEDVTNIKTIAANVGTWMLIFTNFIPISLLVTLEIVKFYQGYFLQVENGLNKISVQSSSLNEELGQIHHVFSDKTGTLTMNRMEFKHLCINGTSYGHSRNEGEGGENFVDFQDESFNEMIKNKSKEAWQAMRCIALCHNVVVEKDHGDHSKDEIENSNSQDGHSMNYNASSPDELALISFAKQCGFVFQGSKKNQGKEFYIINERGQECEYQILNFFEFNSDRKRVSIIVRTPKGEIQLLCKGADSKVEALLDEHHIENQQLPSYIQQTASYASFGLRTLFFAGKIISEEDYSNWSKKYTEAERQLVDRDQKIEKVREEIEKDLLMIGVSAVEDRLQDEVANTVAQIREAGIRFWVLTGDKKETAINVSTAASIIESDWILLVLDAEKESVLDQQLANAMRALDEESSRKHAIILQGECFNLIEHSQKFSKLFVKVALKAQSVVGCRFSPSQKKHVVSLIRQFQPKSPTLSIGDGANDVSMILEAHVGIGVKGVEGSQASRASDYSINEFKQLKELLFDFGRECYRKNSELVLFNFFKNMLLVLPQWWFGCIYSGFSGTTTYDPWIYQMFNTFFTSLPIVLYALFDRQHSKRTLISQSFFYYKQGIECNLFNNFTFAQTILNGFFQAFIIMKIVFVCLENNLIENELQSYFELSGTTIFLIITVYANLKIFTFTNTFQFISFLSVAISISVYVFFYWILTSPEIFHENPLHNTFQLAFFNKIIILTALATISLIFLLDISFQRFNYFIYHQSLYNYSKLPLIITEFQTDYGKFPSQQLSSVRIELNAKPNGYAKMFNES